MSRTGAAFNRGGSKQDYETPPDLMSAVIGRFGRFSWDLAATAENTKAPCWLGPGSRTAEDSLAFDWNGIGLEHMWLNPPFGNVRPWVEKCAGLDVSGHTRGIVLLIPASVGSNYWAEFVDGRAFVLFLRPRVSFVGEKQGFPKDLAICCYGLAPGYECWRWK